MANRAIEFNFGPGDTYDYTDPGEYDETKTGLGLLMKQKNGVSPVDKYVGPMPVSVARPMEQAVAVPATCLWAMRWTDDEDWVFYGDGATAAATRRIGFYRYTRSTDLWAWQGSITLTLPTATNHTIRALRMTYDTYTTGTVAVSGTAVTGTGTAWKTAGFAAGSRIGFGSTDPTAITTWYELSALTDDTNLVLTSSAGTIGAGTSFVIEELRAVVLTTNATAANGGLFVVKGLRPEFFSPAGNTVSAATTVDNIRAVYWLADAATVLNTVGAGLALETKTSNSIHYVWALNGSTTMQLFKYNLRAPLTLASGKSTDAFVYSTGTVGSLTGTVSQVNNGRIASVSHGPGSGIDSIYFVTNTRVYRTVAISAINAGSTTFIADAMIEIPPGGSSTNNAAAGWSSIEHAANIDKFILLSTNANGIRGNYVTAYRTDGSQLDRMFFTETRQINQSSMDSTAVVHATPVGSPGGGWSEGGIFYFVSINTVATANFIYALPFAADWEYENTTRACVVTPKFDVSGAQSLERVYVQETQIVGGSTGPNLGIAPEPYKIYFRTSGIDDDSGAWTLIDQSGSLSGVGAVDEIQFKLAFRTIGHLCVSSRVHGLALVYDDQSPIADGRFQPSVGNSSTASKRFAWRVASAFGTPIPDLRIRLYDATTNVLLLNESSDAPVGTWEQSTNGGSSWAAFDNTDKVNETHYIRFTPDVFPDNIRVRVLLSLA